MGSQFNTALWGGGAPAGTVTVTGTSLIYGALRLLGVLRPGQVPSADSIADGLAWLNDLIDSWATERLTVKVIARRQIVMDGSASYAAVPHRIEGAGYIYSGGSTEQPVKVYKPEEWQAIAQKTFSGSAPVGIYPEYTVAEATVTPWPQPTSGDLYIYQWSPLEAFGDLSTAWVFPAGYALALRYSLAEQLAPAFAIITKIPQPLLGAIVAGAAKYKGAIKSLNSQPGPMVPDNPLTDGGGRYDILSDQYLCHQ